MIFWKNKIIQFIKKRTGRFFLSKRQQFVFITIVLTLIMISTQWFTGGLKIEYVIGLGSATYILSIVVLRQDLKGWEFITLFILPVYYTIAVFLFYYLLPARWITRLPIAFLYAVGMYAILLTENIYNVAAERNIQLLRAGHSVGFLLSLMTNFFLIDTLLSLHLPFYYNSLISIMIIFPLSLQALWSMELTEKISIKVWIISLVIAFVIGQLTLILSFWPIKITIASLFITTVFYSLVGMSQQYLIDRLFEKTIREFLYILIIVLLLVFFTTSWGEGIQF
jgi:hypothetical protein